MKFLKELELRLSESSDGGELEIEHLYASSAAKPYGLHIAVMHEPYFSMVLSGEKSIESRLLKVKQDPFRSVVANDLILFKLSAGPIVAAAEVSKALHLGPLENRKILESLKKYENELCLESGFIDGKHGARYLSLMWLRNVCKIGPYVIRKNDRRAWIALGGGRYEQLSISY